MRWVHGGMWAMVVPGTLARAMVVPGTLASISPVMQIVPRAPEPAQGSRTSPGCSWELLENQVLVLSRKSECGWKRKLFCLSLLKQSKEEFVEPWGGFC